MARTRPRLRRRAPRSPARAASAATADAEVLGRVPYFRSLSATQLRGLARTCSSRALGSGETLFEEGTPCTRLFVIASGRIEIRQTSLRGREQVFHTEQPGAALGEAPLFDGGGYIGSAVALETTRVLSLPRSRLITLCRTHPEVALAIMETLARRVRRFAGIVSDLAFRPVPERLARYLIATAARQPLSPGLELDLQLTQAQLAARLGTVRELVARALGHLEQSGVLSRKGSRVVVRDPVRLRALAEGGE
jgi:CRP/FNR family cyclic AMP-dependent transcriptional regulator